jgi:hypothetical protein
MAPLVDMKNILCHLHCCSNVTDNDETDNVDPKKVKPCWLTFFLKLFPCVKLKRYEQQTPKNRENIENNL